MVVTQSEGSSALQQCVMLKENTNCSLEVAESYRSLLSSSSWLVHHLALEALAQFAKVIYTVHYNHCVCLC